MTTLDMNLIHRRLIEMSATIAAMTLARLRAIHSNGKLNARPAGVSEPSYSHNETPFTLQPKE